MCVHVTVKPWTTVGGGGHAEEKGGEAGFSLSCNTTTSQRISKISGFVFLKIINRKGPSHKIHSSSLITKKKKINKRATYLNIVLSNK